MISRRNDFTSSSILKWTGDINIFEKDYIVLPINENLHWLVAIICFPREVGDKQEISDKERPGMLLFDSMKSYARSQQITRTIRSYLSFFFRDFLVFFVY